LKSGAYFSAPNLEEFTQNSEESMKRLSFVQPDSDLAGFATKGYTPISFDSPATFVIPHRKII
jgi:hypothetical protein